MENACDGESMREMDLNVVPSYLRDATLDFFGKGRRKSEENKRIRVEREGAGMA